MNSDLRKRVNYTHLVGTSENVQYSQFCYIFTAPSNHVRRLILTKTFTNKVLLQWALSDKPPEPTMLSLTGFWPPHDLETDSNSFSISGAHLVKERFQKLYPGFCT